MVGTGYHKIKLLQTPQGHFRLEDGRHLYCRLAGVFNLLYEKKKNKLFNHRFVKHLKENPTPQEIKFLEIFISLRDYEKLRKKDRKKCFQYPFPHDRGFYIVDFYLPNRKVAFEIDGGYHLNNKKIDYDIKRYTYLKETYNIQIVSISNDTIDNLKTGEGIKDFRSKMATFLNEIRNKSHSLYLKRKTKMRREKLKLKPSSFILKDFVYNSPDNSLYNPITKEKLHARRLYKNTKWL